MLQISESASAECIDTGSCMDLGQETVLQTESIPAGLSAALPDPRPEIRRYILENFLFSDVPEDLPDEASLLGLGIIDSVGALEVAQFLEEAFGFVVPEEDMLPENLDSVELIAGYVLRRLQPGDRP